MSMTVIMAIVAEYVVAVQFITATGCSSTHIALKTRKHGINQRKLK